MQKKVLYLVQAAVIAALYIVFTYLAALMGLSSGVIQLRFSEALTILPYFCPAAVPGLFVGCLLSNLLTGCLLFDVICGSLATLLGALGTRYLRRVKHGLLLAPLPPILANTLIVPFVLMWVYGVPDAYWYLLCTVFAGEFLSCGVLGLLLGKMILPYRNKLFRS